MLPDPDVRGRYRLNFYCRVRDLPENVPHHGNPREVNPDKRLCDTVREDFADPENQLFHYMNRGFKILAESTVVSPTGFVDLEISDDPADKGGMIDGRHTEFLLLEKNAAGVALRDVCPDKCVYIEVLVDIPKENRTPVSVALNSSTPISTLSTFNAEGYFETMKAALRGSPMENRIVYVQNGNGEKGAEVSHLIELMFVMRCDLFQDNLARLNTVRGKHPSYIVTSTKQGVHLDFPDDLGIYEQMYGILPQICELYDHIEGETYRFFTSRKQSKKAFDDDRQFTTWTGRESQLTFHRWAVLPMISAFRCLLGLNHEGKYAWKIPFEKVIELYDKVASKWADRVTGDVKGEYKSNSIRISYLQEFAKTRDNWVRFYDDVHLEYIKGFIKFDVPGIGPVLDAKNVSNPPNELQEGWLIDTN